MKFRQQLILLNVMLCGFGLNACTDGHSSKSTAAAQSLSGIINGTNTSVHQSSVCVPSQIPQALRQAPYQLDSFYQKHCDALGLPLLGSSLVKDEALVAAYERVIGMSSALDTQVIKAMADVNTRLAIMSQTELTTDIPEHSDLNKAFPDTDWNIRSRGLGATLARPASSGAEENLLCLTNDTYRGEDIFVHEYAHTIHVMGLSQLGPDFDQRLKLTFRAARRAGLWDKTYAGTNAVEYWAEGGQSWFNVNQEPQIGIHNEVNTRSELQAYDLALYELIADYFPKD